MGKQKKHKRVSKKGKVFIAGKSAKRIKTPFANPYDKADSCLLGDVEGGNTPYTPDQPLNELQRRMTC